ncbi:MAG: autotransporter outer membrane beta-barrel domain-containing protein [Rickettsia endosymbiont of Bryobia graminum]|nr:autotransporter outer membrane beta-barrel domain-containing protein [Rickettsia endosymbiont of Bryobia graminum]
MRIFKLIEYIKYKTQYKDKTKANSFIFSLYGKQNITDGLFVQGLVSYSTAKVRHKEERIFSTGNQFAHAKILQDLMVVKYYLVMMLYYVKKLY